MEEILTPGVDKIVFTGSTKIGYDLMAHHI
jgi:acyl-CoA reductase-like NAD-dependent aldehyde dehydrogenase